MKKYLLHTLAAATLLMLNFSSVAGNVSSASTNTVTASTPSSTTATVAAPSSTTATVAVPSSTTATIAAPVGKNNVLTLEISNAWARKSTSANSNSAVYMKINNPTEKQISIIGASCLTVANKVELHKSFVDEKGVSRMTAIDKIVIPASSEVDLTPGGIHIMLFNLKKNLSTGDKFKITLQLDGMDPIVSDVIVK
ncbi:MAG: copper chaperone PCu(A)C [Rickettsiaceae bacterium]